MSLVGKSEWLDLHIFRRWWAFRAWFRRCPDCNRRGWSDLSPRWEDDKIAQMLGVAHFGCPGCGHGAIEERDAVPSEETP